MASLLEMFGDLNDWADEYVSYIWVFLVAVYLFQACFRKKNRSVNGDGLTEDPTKIPNTDIPRSMLRPRKSTRTAYIFYFSFGFANGSHHIYLDSPAWGLCHMGTLGFCGIGMLLDLIFLPLYVRNHNRRYTHREYSNPDHSFRRIVANSTLVPFVVMCCLASIFFVVPPVYEYSTNTYIGEGKVEKNPYDVLGVVNNAGPDVVKAAFRKLSMKYHPDKNPGREEEVKEQMSELNSAMEKIKKGQAHTWTGSEGYFSEDFLQTVVNKWSVILEDASNKATSMQIAYSKSLAKKMKARKQAKRQGQPANEILSEEFTMGADTVSEMLFGYPIFESSSSTSSNSGTKESNAKSDLEDLAQLKKSLGDIANMMTDEVLLEMLSKARKEEL